MIENAPRLSLLTPRTLSHHSPLPLLSLPAPSTSAIRPLDLRSPPLYPRFPPLSQYPRPIVQRPLTDKSPPDCLSP